MNGVVVLLWVFVLLSSPAFSGEQKNDALLTYVEALTTGNTKQLDTILSPNFEYYFYKNGKVAILSREEELKSLNKIFIDLESNRFNEPVLFERNKINANKIHIKYLVWFEDSPKVHTESLLRGAGIELDEKLNVIVENGKIRKIFEQEETGNNISLGILKYIYINSEEVKETGTRNELAIDVFNKNNHELILRKRSVVKINSVVDSYYWPDSQKIENVK